MFVYCITNDVNGKIYIGKWHRKNLVSRLKGHFVDAVKGSPSYLHRAIRKYGEEKFSIVPVQSVHGIDTPRTRRD